MKPSPEGSPVRKGGKVWMGIVSLKFDFSFKQLMLNEAVRKYFISDVLGIPVSEIRSVRLSNPSLWRRYFRQKQGILDVKVELNEDSIVDIELQIRMLAYWDKRSLYYLAKMFTEGLLIGEKYHRLKKCICINILDFDMNESPEYHRVYRLRDEKGGEFSDLFEIQVVELKKHLTGVDPVNDWIRLFNARSEAELDMIKTTNPGILEAIREVKIMSLRKDLRALYEAHLKERRDRCAREDFVREEGKAEGKAEDILQLLAGKGEIPDELPGVIRGQHDMDTLTDWLLTAARAEIVEDFVEQAGIWKKN